MTKNTHINPNQNLVIYQSEDGQISFNVNVFDETVWLSQKQISQLFNKTVPTINEHIKNCYEEQEVDEYSTIRKFLIVRKEGKRDVAREVEHYNLDVIISVGYRVKSKRGVQFRKWASNVLKQHLISGYSVNGVRIKQIESSLEELVADNKIKTKEIGEIKKLLRGLTTRPIIIHNHNNVSVGSDALEDKVIELLDEMMAQMRDGETKVQLEKVKRDISQLPDDAKAKNRLMRFFKEIGDSNSDIHKIITGAGVTKNIISELVKLGGKLKDIL